MSEYWKSTPKYWCKHCSTYVKDTPLERKQHENTGKHQGNLKRFLQGIQKGHAKSEREKEKAKSEVDRLNRVVGTKSSLTTSSLKAQLPSSIPSSSSTTLSAADQKRQWAQLAEMGVSVPESARAEMAMIGEWKVSSRRIESDAERADLLDDKLNVGVKRCRNNEDDDEVEDVGSTYVRKGWGSATKSYPGQTTEDLSALLTIPIVKKSKPESSLPNDAMTNNVAHPKAQESTESVEKVDAGAASITPIKNSDHRDLWNSQKDDVGIKAESGGDNVEPGKIEVNADVSLPLFKKRKTKSTATQSSERPPS